MKHGVKPTREQRKLLQKWGCDPHDWLVIKDTPKEMQIVHRLFESRMKIISKE